MSSNKIDSLRISQGVCRHCGGPVPCWSSFGDREVGKRYTKKSYTEVHGKDAASKAGAFKGGKK